MGNSGDNDDKRNVSKIKKIKYYDFWGMEKKS